MGSRTRQRRRRGRRLGRRLGRWAWRALLAVLALAIASTLPVLALRWIDPPTSAFMLWREREARIEGEAGFAIDYRWRDLEAIAPSLPLSLVAAEDQRFPDHHGFDVEAIRQALAEHADGGGLRGASTISQQVAKNLFLWSGRSFVRKGLEAWFTTLVELAWPKRRILEVYANIAEFGDGIYGAEAAAQRHFGRPAAALSPSQAARLAAVLPAPRRDDAGRPSDYVLGRQLWIERQMRQLGPGYLEPIGLPAADR